MSSDPFPIPGGGFVHPLLRARDWQDRPEFKALCQWWKDGGVGVCALVGIGGAGKTAIAERFLQVLPGGYPEHPRVPKDRELAAPARLFVFSFYDAPNPDTFLADLAAWLEGRPPASRLDTKAGGVTRPLSYQQTVDLLDAAGRCLLVLDGLEKVQDDGSRGGAFGQILDGRLRNLVLRVADGWLPLVSLVTTSRFRLYDPLAARTWYYRQIGVEQLQSPAAVQLLRDRGVHGTNEQLEHVAHEQGFHALSVDLVGGYIAFFCGGDPQLFSSLTPTPPEPADDTDPALDPRLAALREQERKFARLTERYHQALAKSDPAALALLQRVCLFRLGVQAKTLASIFTGKKKESISGPALASLNEQQLQAKLQLLIEMRLIEASKAQILAQESQLYTVHPAVRDGFLKKLDAETVRLGHNAARAGLEASLKSRPGSNPSDLATLNLLEETVYHTLAAGHSQEAWEIYWFRIGNFRNLGWRLGAYERGERICRAFAAGQSAQSAPLPTGLSETWQAVFLNEWALYLKEIGKLAAAISCYERVIKITIRQEDWRNASRDNQNLADVLLLAGRLTEGLRATEEALELAKRAGNNWEYHISHAYHGYVLAMLGEMNGSLVDFQSALKLGQKPGMDVAGQILWSFRGVQQGIVLARIGRSQEAALVTEKNIEILANVIGTSFNIPKCKLLLAELARERSELAAARDLLHEAQEWALQRDAKELLCWSALVRAKIELKLFNDQRLSNQVDTRAARARASAALETGLQTARECGYALYHIDLLLARAQLALYNGWVGDAENDVLVALEDGVDPSAEEGIPELLAAAHPECLYAWGIAEGHHLLAEALLLQAAQKLGQSKFVPRRFNRLPADIRDLIDRAHQRLDQAVDLWRKLNDPEADADINPRGERTKRVLEGLEDGILTEYPLEPMRLEEPTATPAAPEPGRGTRPVTKKNHVFLSYCRDNRAEVATLHDSLVVAGEAVWWDQDILPGQDWKFEIRKAMRNAYAVVLCLSEETADRITSGIYPEVLDAIGAYREYSPGSIFLIPVRLSDCEIPLIEIDGTRTLDRLQFVDLFPPAQWASELERLLRALQAAPHHP